MVLSWVMLSIFYQTQEGSGKNGIFLFSFNWFNCNNFNMGEIMTMNKKRTVETVKQELSKVDDKIENMLDKDISEIDPRLEKLYTKQNNLDHELDFLTNIMGEK